MATRSEAQRLRRERERRERRVLGQRTRRRRESLSDKRAGTNRTMLRGVGRPIRAQRVGTNEQGQTDGALYRETCWRNGSEYVCLVCRAVSHSPSQHEIHVATEHLGCGIPVKWLEPLRHYEGAGLVIDLQPGFNVWRPA